MATSPRRRGEKTWRARSTSGRSSWTRLTPRHGTTWGDWTWKPAGPCWPARPAAVLPMSVGAVALGAAWVATRHQLTPAKRRLREVLKRGRAEYDRLWQAWLDGAQSREGRDAAIDRMVEKMALDLVHPHD